MSDVTHVATDLIAMTEHLHDTDFRPFHIFAGYIENWDVPRYIP